MPVDQGVLFCLMKRFRYFQDPRLLSLTAGSRRTHQTRRLFREVRPAMHRSRFASPPLRGTAVGAVLLLVGVVSASSARSQDPNFHIYLAFGQSNMDGAGQIEEVDRAVDSRFQVLSAFDCPGLGREKGLWYPATPPLAKCTSGLSPADYFGRTMVATLPDSVRVGIINVAVPGAKIELFDKDTYQAYVASVTEDWLINFINEYDGDPYGYLVDLARIAQQDGVIKGFLLHQGESNSGDQQWPAKVKSIYDDLVADLGLDPGGTPLFAGELVHRDQGGVVAGMNDIIGRLPQALPNAYVVSSSGCTDKPDNLHFDSAGNRCLGVRYGIQALALMGYEVSEPEPPEPPPGTVAQFYEAECGAVGADWEIAPDAQTSGGRYVTAAPGLQSTDGPPTDPESTVVIPFTLGAAGVFNLYARLSCPTYDDDSFFVKVDDGEYITQNGLVTTGWEWRNLNTFDLSAGEHTLTIAFREDGARLDKVAISDYATAPTGVGENALNACTSTGKEGAAGTESGYLLEQNVPNPSDGRTSVRYRLPHTDEVTFEVVDVRGRVVYREERGAERAGTHTVNVDTAALSDGVYVYRLRTAAGFSESKQMVLLR